MTPRSQAQLFLERNGGMGGSPFLIGIGKDQIAEIESENPGFSSELRTIALQALDSGDMLMRRKGIRSLMYVGKGDDMSRLQKIMSIFPDIRKEVSTAIFEIKQRVRNGLA